jgi:hypothetical protein
MVERCPKRVNVKLFCEGKGCFVLKSVLYNFFLPAPDLRIAKLAKSLASYIYQKEHCEFYDYVLQAR